MEFHEKLQELRRNRGLTQEELAACLYVSRTAVSKWESGRGYPNIASLKAIAELFSVSVDQLLSGEELIDAAQEDTRQKVNHTQDLVFGLLDVCVAMLLFLPVFAQRAGGEIRAVSLFSLITAPYLQVLYWGLAVLPVVMGIFTLALQNCERSVWLRSKRILSVCLNAAGVLMFIIGLQPYPAIFLFAFLAVKVLMLVKKG